jgi:predicted nucleotidyltransferase
VSAIDLAIGPDLPAELGRALAPVRDGDPRADIAAIVAALEQATGVAICGVILYGSHTQARATVTSDLDLLVLSPAEVTGGLWGQAAGVEIDAHVRNLGVVLEALEDWPHVAGGRVLHDTSGQLAGWIERLNALRAGPRPAVPASTRLRDRVWSARMLRRIARNAPRDPGLAALQLGSLLGALPELHAQERGQWPQSISAWLAELRRDEPAAAALVDALGRAIDTGGALVPLTELIELACRDDPD